MINFVWLVFGHFIADWAFQNEFVANNKGKYWFIMFAHCMVWAGILGFVLFLLDISALWKLGFLIGGHWVCDKWKCNKITYLCSTSREDENRNLKLLYIDQAWHIVQCAVVSF